MELPSAWSGSKRTGAADVETRTVEIESAFAVDMVADRSGRGSAVIAAAAPVAPRNFRRDILEFFMGTGKYKRKLTRQGSEFHSMKVVVATHTQESGVLCSHGQAMAAVTTLVRLILQLNK
jgi:hypothetical protein